MGSLENILGLRKHPSLCLRPYYRRRPHLWSPMLKRIDARMAVSLKWRYAYARIPKAANSTVVRTLLGHFPENDDPDAYKDQFLTPAALSAKQVRDLQSHFVFTFVRNPFHRVLSAYLNKLLEQDASREKYTPYVEAVRRCDGGQITFRGFCRYLQKQGLHANCHWMPQTRLVETLGLARMNHIGRLESLRDDLQRVVDRIAGRHQPVNVQNAGPAATRAGERAKEYYDEESRQLISDLYRGDFDAFAYPHHTVAPGQLLPLPQNQSEA